MAQDINSVVLVGNLVRDLGSAPNGKDFGYTQSGVAIATISIASNRSRKQSDGSYMDEVSYFDIHLYGKTAENLKPYLVKGQKIAVEGVLKQERWQDKQTGNNMSKIVINANSVQLLGGKREDNGFNPNTPYQSAQEAVYASRQQAGGYNQQNYQQPQQTANNGGFKEDIPWDESIPF